MLSLCGAPPQGLYKAPHDSGVCCKQFMMLLVWRCFPCMSRVDEGIRVCVTGRRSARAASVLPCFCSVSSVVGGVEVRPPLGIFIRVLFSQAMLVLRGNRGVAS